MSVHDPLRAIVDTQRALRTLAALSAAGVATDPTLHRAAIGLLTSTANALAILEASTPRQVYADSIEVAPEDDHWRLTTLHNATEHGRRLLEEGRRDDDAREAG